MKIRNDFVSNSSSSSFMLYGVMFEKSELENNFKNSMFKCVKKTFDDNKESIYFTLKNLINGGDFIIDEEDGNVAIGISPQEMKDNETLLAFKEKVITLLKTIGIEKEVSDVQFISGINSDGYISFD